MKKKSAEGPSLFDGLLETHTTVMRILADVAKGKTTASGARRAVALAHSKAAGEVIEEALLNEVRARIVADVQAARRTANDGFVFVDTVSFRLMLNTASGDRYDAARAASCVRKAGARGVGMWRGRNSRGTKRGYWVRAAACLVESDNPDNHDG